MLRRGGRLVTRVLLVAIIASAICLLIASGLDGSGRSLAMVFGVAAAAGAVGAAAIARWRLMRVTAREDRLVDEVRRLVDRDQQARRVVIETVETEAPTGSRSMVMWSQQFGSLHQSTMAAPGEFQNLNTALRAVISLPGLLLLSVLSIVALGGLSLLFAIAVAI